MFTPIFTTCLVAFALSQLLSPAFAQAIGCLALAAVFVRRIYVIAYDDALGNRFKTSFEKELGETSGAISSEDSSEDSEEETPEDSEETMFRSRIETVDRIREMFDKVGAPVRVNVRYVFSEEMYHSVTEEAVAKFTAALKARKRVNESRQAALASRARACAARKMVDAEHILLAKPLPVEETVIYLHENDEDCKGFADALIAKAEAILAENEVYRKKTSEFRMETKELRRRIPIGRGLFGEAC